MHQLLYTSTSTQPALGDQLSNILLQSRRNNPANGLTGLLWTDGSRFLQVLEGERAAINDTLARIRKDPRHRAVVVLHEREVAERTFGHWSMALVSDSDERIAAALGNADPVVKGTFEGMIACRKAAA